MSEYPSEEDLEKIRHWNWKKDSPLELVDFICEIWNKTYGSVELSGGTLKLWTGGWSGNEDIVRAMLESDFGMLYWEQSTRGGFYIFKNIGGEK